MVTHHNHLVLPNNEILSYSVYGLVLLLSSFIICILISKNTYALGSSYNTPEEAYAACSERAVINNAKTDDTRNYYCRDTLYAENPPRRISLPISPCRVGKYYPPKYATIYFELQNYYPTTDQSGKPWDGYAYRVRCKNYVSLCTNKRGVLVDGFCIAFNKTLGLSPCNNTPSTQEGNPCDASSGNKFQSEVDYLSKTLNFTRYYNSLSNTESVLGKQWKHNFLASLTIDGIIKINRNDGKVLEFNNVSGIWKSEADITETLTQIGTQWKYKTSNNSTEIYNSTGQLLSMTSLDGKTTTYTYNPTGLLEQVTDPYSRTLNFSYDSSNRLVTLTTPENTQIHYIYDDNTNNLVSVIYPDATPSDLTDNPQKIYHYEDAAFPSHLTGITDENNVRYATWAYNENGLAILSEHANSAEKVELVYNADETTTVTDALGRIKTYTFEPHFGLRKPKTIEYTYHDGQQSITKNKTYTYYPENGRVKEITDYNGNITYYEYNARGLITLETKAKGLPEEYTVSTTWHPDFRLPEMRIYPKQTIRYEYYASDLLRGQLKATHITINP